MRGHGRFYDPSVAAGFASLTSEQLILDWCEEICDTDFGRDLPHMIATSWVMQSPVEAMNFIVSMPNAVEVRTGARAAYRRFIKADSDGALAWMETTTEEQRNGKVLQGSLAMYVNTISAQGKHMLALEWLDYILDDEERELGLVMIVRRWLRTNESDAEAWIAQSSMSEESKLEAHRKKLAPVKR